MFTRRHTTAAAIIMLLVGVAGCITTAPEERWMEQLKAEAGAALEQRDQRARFDLYQAYSDGRLSASAGDKTWDDKTGNCRLRWYDELMHEQLQAPYEAEILSRRLHAALRDADELDTAFDLIADRLEMSSRDSDMPGHPELLNEPYAVLFYLIANARESFEAALAPLDADQEKDLRSTLYETTTRQVEGLGSRFPDGSRSRRACDYLELMNRDALYAGARALMPLGDRQLLESLRDWPARPVSSVEGVSGELTDVIRTSAGKIVVGGPGENAYDLDSMTDTAMLIDTGGNDTYREGSLSQTRPVLVIVDIGGDDQYRGEKPGIQGGAVLGISMLVDLAGDDIYDGQDVAQGACVGGIGILIDHAGDDSYRGLRRNQGSAMGGIAMLIDRSGADAYHSALYAQGFGGPLGFGVLDDLGGEDHYYAGGKWLDVYDDTRGYNGWSQGVGAGPRGTANGGIGVLLDGGGDDLYECDYFSHGGGYWFAVGIARDFGGDDQRIGPTRLAYDGTERGEPRFLRWGLGWQAHYGLGFLFDDAGDDTYGGNIVGLGFSWDIGVAGLLDFEGDDHYQLTYGAQGQQAALGFLFDRGGDDRYGGEDYGGAPTNIIYHPLPDCGGNFAFSINIGGRDVYGTNEWHGVMLQRQSPGGFLVDRD